MTLRQNIIDGFIIFTVLVHPLLIAMLALWTLRDRAADQAIYIVVGSGLTGLWSSLLLISGNSITRERWSGTLGYLFGTPANRMFIFLGRAFFHILDGMLGVVLGFI